jgi:uridine kinase
VESPRGNQPTARVRRPGGATITHLAEHLDVTRQAAAQLVDEVKRYDAATIRDLLTAVTVTARRPVLIGIDGPGGSGKSTLARELREQMPMTALVVEGDDFYRLLPDAERLALTPSQGYDLYFDWERLRDQVLVPVGAGRPRLTYQKYDWTTDQMGSWVDVPMPDAVIMEGVYVLRPALRPLFDLAVVVETSAPVRLGRQQGRGENAGEWIRRWMAAEDYYITRHAPAGRADLVVQGEHDACETRSCGRSGTSDLPPGGC